MKAAEIVARFSGARRVPVTALDCVPCAFWGTCTGVETLEEILEFATYGKMWLGDDGQMRIICPESTKNFSGEIVAISYRAKSDGHTQHYRHVFDRKVYPVARGRENLLTLETPGYMVGARGFVNQTR